MEPHLSELVHERVRTHRWAWQPAVDCSADCRVKIQQYEQKKIIKAWKESWFTLHSSNTGLLQYLVWGEMGGHWLYLRSQCWHWFTLVWF